MLVLVGMITTTGAFAKGNKWKHHGHHDNHHTVSVGGGDVTNNPVAEGGAGGAGGVGNGGVGNGGTATGINGSINIGTIGDFGQSEPEMPENNRTFSPDATVKNVGNRNGNNGANGNNGNNNGNNSADNRSNAKNEGNNTNVDASDNSTTVYEAADIPVSTAYAPALTSSNDTCMGSTSVGGQGLLLGVSFGTTWTDDDCITRKDARFVHNAGHRTVALSLMCGKEAVRAAVARAGTPEQLAACAITTDEITEYRAKPVIVQVRRRAPDRDDQFDD